MQWMRAVIVTMLLSSTTVSQDDILRKGAGDFQRQAFSLQNIEALIESAYSEKKLQPKDSMPKPAPARRELERAKLQSHKRQAMFDAVDKLDDLFAESNKSKLFDFGRLPQIIQELEQVASKRVPSNATDSQREKLKVAAKLDIRHTVSKYCASYAEGGPAKLEKVRTAQNGGELDVFGSGSLFEKVLRQQGLLDN